MPLFSGPASKQYYDLTYLSSPTAKDVSKLVVMNVDDNFLDGDFYFALFYPKSLLVWMGVAINNVQRCVSWLAENDSSIS